MASHELIRDGYAWVGVSAQLIGVEGGPSDDSRCPRRFALKTWDSGALRHRSRTRATASRTTSSRRQARRCATPGGADAARRAARRARVIAAGESQSALPARAPTSTPSSRCDHVYDGFLVHSRERQSARRCRRTPQPADPRRRPSRMIRTDLDVPVLVFETETDALGHFPARQPDSATLPPVGARRLVPLRPGRPARAPPRTPALLFGTSAPVSSAVPPCGYQINRLPSHYVVSAAVNRIDRWVRDGTPPPTRHADHDRRR